MMENFNMTRKQRLKIAKHILDKCYWGNTTMTPQYILSHIQNKDFAQMIFSVIFENSQDMIQDLSIIDDGVVEECIIFQNKRLGHFKRDFLEPRLDFLIRHYGIKNAGERRKIHTII